MTPEEELTATSIPGAGAAATPEIKYAAFISYRRVDGSRVAERLRYRLLEYKLPRGFSPQPLDIYIDRIYEHATEDFFRKTIMPALRASRALILVQTPMAAVAQESGEQNWVVREVQYFRTLPQGNNIWVALGAGDLTDPLPADLSRDLPNVERVDVRPLDKWWGRMSEHELLKFIGPLHRIPVESMPNLRRDAENRVWRRAVRWASAAVLVIAALASLAGIAFYQMKLAKANQRLAEERATVAESRRLAAGAESQLDTSPEASLTLALEGALVARTDDAINALRDALPRSRLRLRVQGGNGAMSDNGMSVATAVPYSKDVVSVWDVATRRVRFTLHPGEVSHLVFSPDGRRLLTSTWARPIVAWDAIDGRRLQALGLSRLPSQVSHDSRRVLTADFEHRVHLWDLESGQELATFSGHSDEITDMRFSPDDKLVATSSNDHTVKLWDAASKKLLRTITHKEKVWSVRFDPSGEVVVTASGDVARVWDARNGRLKNSVEGLLGGENVVFEAEISAHRFLGGPILLHERGRCTVWNPSLADLLERSIRPAIELKSDQNVEETPCMVSPDGGLVATGEGLWNIETKEKTADFLHAGGSAGGAVKFSRDGQSVLVARDSETEVWAVGPESPAATLEASGSQLLAGALALTMAVSPDGTRAAFVSGQGQLAVWNLSTRKKLWEVQAHAGSICDVAFNADGTKLLSGGEDQAVRLWDAQNGKRLGEFLGHKSWVWQVAFVPGHDTVFSVGNDARLWNPATGAQKYLFGGHVEVIYSSAISPDGTRAMTGDRDSVHVWDLDSGRELPALKVPSQVVSQITFSPSGKYVVTVSGRVNGPLAAAVWATASGKKVGQVTAYKADAVFGPQEDILATEGGLINWRTGKTVLALGGDPVWSPNQRCVLTKGASGVDLRDAWTGRTYLTFRLNGDLFAGALFSRDGSFILTGDSPVRLFTTESCLSVDRLIATAQQRVYKEVSSDAAATPSATPTTTAKE